MFRYTFLNSFVCKMACLKGTDIHEGKGVYYRPFHKTLPRSSAFLKWSSVKFYETGCSRSMGKRIEILLLHDDRDMGRGYHKERYILCGMFSECLRYPSAGCVDVLC